MVIGSLWLVGVTMTVMVNYVVFVFARKPYREHLWPRLYLAMAGVSGVMIAANTGIFFATMLQIPLTFASQFVMFIVLGIGLDGVFLLTDTFDQMDVRLSVDERVVQAVAHAGV